MDGEGAIMCLLSIEFYKKHCPSLAILCR